VLSFFEATAAFAAAAPAEFDLSALAVLLAALAAASETSGGCSAMLVPPGLCAELAHEAVRRAQSVEVSTFCLLLRMLPALRADDVVAAGAACDALRALLNEALRGADELPPLQALPMCRAVAALAARLSGLAPLPPTRGSPSELPELCRAALLALDLPPLPRGREARCDLLEHCPVGATALLAGLQRATPLVGPLAGAPAAVSAPGAPPAGGGAEVVAGAQVGMPLAPGAVPKRSLVAGGGGLVGAGFGVVVPEPYAVGLVPSTRS